MDFGYVAKYAINNWLTCLSPLLFVYSIYMFTPVIWNAFTKGVIHSRIRTFYFSKTPIQFIFVLIVQFLIPSMIGFGAFVLVYYAVFLPEVSN